MTSAEDVNKAIALEAFDTLFNKRDYAAAERMWSPDYIQHSARIAPGRDGIFERARSMPTLRYECELAMAERGIVMLRGRFSGNGQAPRGSWPTSCASRTASWRSTGTSSNPRPPARSR
ncbi:hypothetical protein ABH931_005073 [Streptacidiphilus sp. MAP12-33]|uniref:nuclear transport factor 2 family protein n=1 Tax=Streptacidiphilus sp. MAP12-33 TaxID=3156266 RepID=UPI003514BB9C